MYVDDVIKAQGRAAVVYDVSEDRWEAWHGGHAMSAACEGRDEALRLVFDAMRTQR
ncbi:MAG: hypothetical protein M3Z25_04920 [Actinomycetota bacterium]|nr:hypothetical protein [Actinomycetota bacterium]